MNPLKKFLNLLPQQKVFYGKIIQKSFDILTVELFTGGLIEITSDFYSNVFDNNSYVWMTRDNNIWKLENAPQFSASYDLQI